MPVVYNGVPGTSQGDLFQGFKLWMAQRIPQRARWIDLVKGNGGEVVRLEKNADMLIADNVKVAGVSPPVGSYMWRWIDDSVKNGFLQDKDDYLIGRREGSARDPGTSEQTKVGRTPFTKKDDLTLTKWIAAEERMGNALSGTVIYKALERKHPHHTWQSWRDRWVKTLKSKPRPNFSEQEIGAEIDRHRSQSPEPAPGPAGSYRHAQPSQAAEPQRRVLPNTQNGPAASPGRAPMPAATAGSRSAGPKGRTFFTEEEDQMLLELIEKVRQENRVNGREANKHLSGNVIYQGFAEKHPNHPWHSWRDRWVRHLSLIESVDDAGPDEASNADPGETRGLNARRLLQQPRMAGDVQATATATNATLSAAPVPSSAKQQPNSKSDDQRLKRHLRERREARAALVIEKIWRGHAVRRDMARLEADVVDLQSLWRGYVARMRMISLAEAREPGSDPGEADFSQDGEQYQDAEEEIQRSDVGSNEVSPEDRDPREQFYDDMQVVLEVIGVEINREPTINGQSIDLWDLYRLARQQDCELEARNWKLITEGLGFEPVNGLVWKVQACYLQNLAEFEHHMKTFESNDSVDEEAVEEQGEIGSDAALGTIQPTSDAVTAPKQPAADSSSPAYRSSPPIARSKRILEHTDLLRSGSGYPSSGPRKRRRVDRSSVIPPTPEEKLGLSKTPLDSPAMPDNSSPLKKKKKDLINGGAIDICTESDLDELLGEGIGDAGGQDELPTLSNRDRKTFIEPETQDWHLPQDPFLLDDEDDVSPSQQLHLESDVVNGPQQIVPKDRSAVVEEEHLSVPTRKNSEGLGGLSTRVLRSNSQRAATILTSSRVPITGKVKKRTLPDSYQRKKAPTASATNGYSVSQSQLQRNDTITVRPSSTAPVRAMSDKTSLPRQASPYTPAHGAKSSTNRTLAFSPPAPQQLTTDMGAPASQNTEAWEAAHVEAQFSHFQALGYKTNHIHQAMEAATMSRGPMVVALESLSKGAGLPQNEPGVWTPQDCNNLRMIKKYERQIGKGKGIAGPMDSKIKVMAWELGKKHSEKEVEFRWKFMQMAGETEGV